MKFIIRDDDLSFFSKPTDIQQWYEDIFNQQIPVGFSTIPFVTGLSDVYIDITAKAKEYPIHLNHELCEYVRYQPLIQILQHGCTHEVNNGVFEYETSVDLHERTFRGNQELQAAFKRKIEIFVAPHDWISKKGIEAVEDFGMDIISGRSTGWKNFIPRIEYLFALVRLGFHRLTRGVLAYPYVINFGKHREVCSYRLESEDIFEGLAYTNAKNGIFVVVTHLHFYNEEKKARLMLLIAEAKKHGAEFALPSSIFI